MTYPIVVAVIAFTFSAILLRQFGRRHKPHQLVWGFSLALGGVAATSFVLFLADGRSELFFRLYYVCGALLMAAYLGLGSIYLLAPRQAAHRVAAGLVMASAVGLVLVAFAPIDTFSLRTANVEAGTHVIGGPAVVAVAVLNTFGAVAVIGGAILSAWRVARQGGPGRILAANVLIATGTVLASLAGTLARLTGDGRSFWLLLACGFVVLFGGFLLTMVSQLRNPLPGHSAVETTA